MQQVKKLKDIIECNARKRGNIVAIKYKNKNVEIEKTYMQLQNDVMVLSHSINGMRIGIMGENCYDWLLIYYATIISNGIIVPMAPDTSPERAIEMAKKLNLDAIAAGNNCIKKIEDYISKKNININIIRMNYGTLLNLKCAFENVEKIYGKGKENKNTCAIYFTSGTTGESKGVMLGNEQLISNCIAIQDALQFESSRISLNVLPFHHGFASMCDLIYTIYIGGTLCILEDLRLLNEEMDRYKPQNIFVVPLIAENLLKRIKYEEKDASINILKLKDYLENVICGGAKIRKGMVEDYQSTGINLIRGYGITECSPVVAVMRKNKKYDAETVGTPLICNKIMIKEGEVCVKGSNVMLGYYADSKSTLLAMKDDWFRTGDYGRVNKDGDLYIVGRKKNLIILDNGENIVPEEIEEKIDIKNVISECLVFEERRNDQRSQISVVIVPQIKDKSNMELNVHNIEREIIDDYNKSAFGKNIKNIYYSDKPFARTSTQKVKREQTLNYIIKDIVEKEVKESIQSVLYEKINLRNEMKFIEDLGMDSYEIVRLIGEIEKRLAIVLCPEDIYRIRDIQHFIDYIFIYHVQVDACTVTWKKEKTDGVVL